MNTTETIRLAIINALLDGQAPITEGATLTIRSTAPNEWTVSINGTTLGVAVLMGTTTGYRIRGSRTPYWTLDATVAAMLGPDTMNRTMRAGILKGETINVSPYQVDGDPSLFILPEWVYQDGKDYADTATESWVRSIGKDQVEGTILAATDERFYQMPGFECIWLR